MNNIKIGNIEFTDKYIKLPIESTYNGVVRYNAIRYDHIMGVTNYNSRADRFYHIITSAGIEYVLYSLTDDNYEQFMGTLSKYW